MSAQSRYGGYSHRLLWTYLAAYSFFHLSLLSLLESYFIRNSVVRVLVFDFLAVLFLMCVVRLSRGLSGETEGLQYKKYAIIFLGFSMLYLLIEALIGLYNGNESYYIIKDFRAGIFFVAFMVLSGKGSKRLYVQVIGVSALASILGSIAYKITSGFIFLDAEQYRSAVSLYGDALGNGYRMAYAGKLKVAGYTVALAVVFLMYKYIESKKLIYISLIGLVALFSYWSNMRSVVFAFGAALIFSGFVFLFVKRRVATWRAAFIPVLILASAVAATSLVAPKSSSNAEKYKEQVVSKGIFNKDAIDRLLISAEASVGLVNYDVGFFGYGLGGASNYDRGDISPLDNGFLYVALTLGFIGVAALNLVIISYGIFAASVLLARRTVFDYLMLLPASFCVLSIFHDSFLSSTADFLVMAMIFSYYINGNLFKKRL